MKVALYPRVSTADKDQDPETQVMALKDHCRVEGWEIYDIYIDRASARDLSHRKEWRRLNDDAAKRRFSAVVVFKLDRAFRSTKHLYDTLSAWELVDVKLISIRENFDTTSAMGRLILTVLSAIAEFELEMISERVKAGIARAKRQGKQIGRPKVIQRRGFKKRFSDLLDRINAGEISRRKAARELNIGYATLKRLIDAQSQE